MGSKYKFVCGVGINDAGYSINPSINGRRKMCKFYECWSDMVKRCYSENTHKKFPTYSNCSVCSDWLLFSVFKKWMEKQDWKGKQIDKDLKNLGNKVYSPENCMFVSSHINSLLIDSKKARGALPQGVYFHKREGKYRAQVSNYGKQRIIGSFNCPRIAELAYLNEKLKIVIEVSKNETEEISAALLKHANLILKEITGKTTLTK